MNSSAVMPESNESSGNRYALIVYCTNYSDTVLNKLPSAEADARALERVLSDERLGRFSVETLADPAWYQIGPKIEEFVSDKEPADTLLIHFSGHGLKDRDGKLYLAGANTDTRLVRSTAVPATQINEFLSGSSCKRKILILDCCYGGAFTKGIVRRGTLRQGAPNDVLNSFNAKEGYVVITSSGALQYAFEGDTVEGTIVPSAFSGLVVRGIETGDADADLDGHVTVHELFNYVERQMPSVRSEQKPEMNAFRVQGDLLVSFFPFDVVETTLSQDEAKRGVEKSVEVDGKDYRVEIPPGVTNGVRIRVRAVPINEASEWENPNDRIVILPRVGRAQDVLIDRFVPSISFIGWLRNQTWFVRLFAITMFPFTAVHVFSAMFPGSVPWNAIQPVRMLAYSVINSALCVLAFRSRRTASDVSEMDADVIAAMNAFSNCLIGICVSWLLIGMMRLLLSFGITVGLVGDVFQSSLLGSVSIFANILMFGMYLCITVPKSVKYFSPFLLSAFSLTFLYGLVQFYVVYVSVKRQPYDSFDPSGSFEMFERVVDALAIMAFAGAISQIRSKSIRMLSIMLFVFAVLALVPPSGQVMLKSVFAIMAFVTQSLKVLFVCCASWIIRSGAVEWLIRSQGHVAEG